MKLSEQEKAARRAAFRNMRAAEKLDHVWTYYKWPILLGLLALIVLGSALHRELGKKEPVLYLAFANVVAGEDLEEDLTDGFLRFLGADAKKREVYLYRDLYLSDDADTLNHEYAYASKMKLMGAVSAGKLDLVLMNREAYDLLSRSGYLLELSPALFTENAALYAQVLPILSSNEVVLSDNSIEYQLGEAETLEVETETVRNALDVSSLPLFARAGFPDAVYLGVIANSERLSDCIAYISFISKS
ncbi:MAG: hypothetical protein IJH48_06430 [Oscillospiraceae bacterium]|nr:hypothetical protein [Oscillospiraceae bacterium]